MVLDQDLEFQEDLVVVVEPLRADHFQEEQEIHPQQVHLKVILEEQVALLVEHILQVVVAELLKQVVILLHQDQADQVEMDLIYQTEYSDQQLLLMEHQDQFLLLDILQVVVVEQVQLT